MAKSVASTHVRPISIGKAGAYKCRLPRVSPSFSNLKGSPSCFT
ncbi:MAG TPA: hypothetical protein VE616_04810 [Candidatus Udaeobacter sp.]|nr:hypothetical protein [Candidatus Udaeobacter sp.]